MSERIDLIIAGGGAAGLSLALAVHVASDGALTVAVCDPALSASHRGDSRAYALVAGARRFLDSLGAWQGMAAAAEPITGMDITDSGLNEPVRPLILNFGGERPDGEPFAHMVPNGAILAALTRRAQEVGIRLVGRPVEAVERSPRRVRVRADACQFDAPLLVAADGKASALRQQAGIPFYGWDYGQTAIVGTISHSLPHQGRAVEHFLPAGPFAMLPLPGNACSLVWTERTVDARRFLAMPQEDLIDQIDRRAAGRFGVITAVRDIGGFPLSLGIARSFVAERLALLGDAAHVMHPIAGQGLNYGLRGAAALAETIVDSARVGLDIGSPVALEPYERSRRSDVVRMALATDALNRLFSNDAGPLRLLRDVGLGLVERAPRQKDWFIAEAAGETAAAPRAFRGLAI
ncbi:MAG TPA: FAD-dependent monooxygenase [Beijerinckiaceae bacterium]|nr:FAD-dependent monooxygenase [Beijerinckiaceae bacterium]